MKFISKHHSDKGPDPFKDIWICKNKPRDRSFNWNYDKLRFELKDS